MPLRCAALLLLLLTAQFIGRSQVTARYFTDEYKPCEPDKASFIRQGVPEGERWHVFEFKSHFKTPYSETMYVDSNFTIADGVYLEYSDYATKKISTRGQYINGKKAGLWRSFFESGKLFDSLLYAGGHLIRSVTYYQSGRLKDSTSMDAEGNGISHGFREDGITEHTGQMSHWKKTGDWTYYTREGVICATETMNADTIVHALFYDALGKNPVVIKKDFEFESDFPGGESAWLAFINKSMPGGGLPEDYMSGKVYGTVIVEFMVDTSGKVTDVNVVQSVHPRLDEMAVVAVKRSSGKWIPGRQHNRLVNTYKRQPVTFGQVQQ